MVYFTLIKGKDRSYWLPGNRVKELILKSKLTYSNMAKCEMECRSISEKDVMIILKNGEVNFKESNVHGQPHPSYSIDGSLSGNKKIRVITDTYDSIAEIKTVDFLNAETKPCLCQ